jgi:hypothetical protein
MSSSSDSETPCGNEKQCKRPGSRKKNENKCKKVTLNLITDNNTKPFTLHSMVESENEDENTKYFDEMKTFINKKFQRDVNLKLFHLNTNDAAKKAAKKFAKKINKKQGKYIKSVSVESFTSENVDFKLQSLMGWYNPSCILDIKHQGLNKLYKLETLHGLSSSKEGDNFKSKFIEKVLDGNNEFVSLRDLTTVNECEFKNT